MRIILFLLLISSIGLSAQQTVVNMDLPVSNGGGSTIGDIITANGLEVLNYDGADYGHEETIKTAYPVYHIVANSDGSKLMFFNKLNAYNTGLYSYTAPNGPLTYINIETAVGDVIYNPFQDQFLISKFKPGEANIIVLNASDNSLEDPIIITSGQYAKEMFISPQGRLYITSNMQYEDGQHPKINIYDATDTQYGVVASGVLTDFETYEGGISTYYFANFDYNPSDEKVYATFTVQEQKLQPYNTEASSIFRSEGSDPIIPPGKLVVLSDVIVNQFNLTDYPYKVICPSSKGADESSQYYGKLFVVGEMFYEYDYLNPPANSSEIDSHSHHFIDIAYSSTHDMLFGVKDKTVTGTVDNRIFEIWTITMGEFGLEFNMFNIDHTDCKGQIANIFSNPYDGRIYVYRKIDAPKLGDGQVSLYSFNPNNPNPTWEITPLGMATYFPDYDHSYDLPHFFFNNITTPHINPYTNSIYLPNGGHISVSKVSFTPLEELNLDAGINWISIPRHEGNGVSGTYDPWPTASVFNKTNFGNQYSSLRLEYYDVEATNPEIVYASYNIEDQQAWYYSDNDMNQTYSYRGYKLYTYPTTANTLTLTGNVEDPNTTIELIETEENWVGYFLFEKQDIFDAIADFKDQIYTIKHQDYFCYYGIPMEGPQPTPYDPFNWYCDKQTHNIAYGEMVVLKPYSDIPDFKWNSYFNPPTPAIDEEAEYYTYTETADYSAFIIELDSTENALEMGAFVNDSCIGACTITPEDTLAIIKGYLGTNPGDSVVLEEHFGTKSSNNQRISDYYVLNQTTRIHEKRVIKTGENKDMYFISFKDEKVQKNTDIKLTFNIFPNPASKNINMVYNVNKTSMVSIIAYDNYGRKIATLLSAEQPIGSHSFEWKLIGDTGKKLNKGLYIIKLKINNDVISKKVVIN